MDEKIKNLLGNKLFDVWYEMIQKIESKYEMDENLNKGFGSWIYEYKFRRGGKTLCTLYAKQNEINLLITLGKKERESFEQNIDKFSDTIKKIYFDTTTYHDGKWLWLPLEDTSLFDDIMNMLILKRKPNRKD